MISDDTPSPKLPGCQEQTLEEDPTRSDLSNLKSLVLLSQASAQARGRSALQSEATQHPVQIPPRGPRVDRSTSQASGAVSLDTSIHNDTIGESFHGRENSSNRHASGKTNVPESIQQGFKSHDLEYGRLSPIGSLDTSLPDTIGDNKSPISKNLTPGGKGSRVSVNSHGSTRGGNMHHTHENGGSARPYIIKICGNQLCLRGGHFTVSCKGAVQESGRFRGTILACVSCNSSTHTTDLCPTFANYGSDRKEFVLHRLLQYQRQGLAPMATTSWAPKLEFQPKDIERPVLTTQQALDLQRQGKLIKQSFTHVELTKWRTTQRVTGMAEAHRGYEPQQMGGYSTGLSATDHLQAPRTLQDRSHNQDSVGASSSVHRNDSEEVSSRNDSRNHERSMALNLDGDTRSSTERLSSVIEISAAALPTSSLSYRDYESFFGGAMDLGRIQGRSAFAAAQDFFRNTPGALEFRATATESAFEHTPQTGAAMLPPLERSSNTRVHRWTQSDDKEDEDDWDRRRKAKRKDFGFGRDRR